MNVKIGSMVVTMALSGLLAGCDSGGEAAAQSGERAANGVLQTQFPGQVSAGSAPSGVIMAQTKSETKQAETPAQKEAAQEGQRGQGGTAGNVAGTPGIPEGAGGTPSGANMGGTTPQAAASQIPPSGGAPAQVPPAPAAPSEKQAASKAEQEKRDLAAAMDRVAERWRNRAQQQGWKTHEPVSEQTSGAPANAPPLIIRSEKFGTAPPSEDVKKPAEKGK